MKKKLITIFLVAVLALGGSGGVFAAANSPTVQRISDTATIEQPIDSVAANMQTTITEVQAKQIALDSVKGVTFVSIGLQDKDGVIAYDVEVLSGTNINDINVDANTGKILHTDHSSNNSEKHHLEEKSKDDDGNEYEISNEDVIGY